MFSSLLLFFFVFGFIKSLTTSAVRRRKERKNVDSTKRKISHFVKFTQAQAELKSSSNCSTSNFFREVFFNPLLNCCSSASSADVKFQFLFSASTSRLANGVKSVYA